MAIVSLPPSLGQDQPLMQGKRQEKRGEVSKREGERRGCGGGGGGQPARTKGVQGRTMVGPCGGMKTRQQVCQAAGRSVL